MYDRQEMACKFVVGNHGGSRALGRRCKQEDTIKRVLKEIV